MNTDTTTPASSKHLSLLNTSSSPTAASSLPSPPYSPPPTRSTPLTDAHIREIFTNDATKALKATRRQSSISYVSSRVDVYSRHAQSTSTTVSDALIGTNTVHGIGSSSEFGGGPKRTSRSMKRRTMAGLEELRGLNAVGEARAHVSVGSASASGGIERVALTLAEKHADLLHAIAAAESKRLELTGQLAAVEGDLGELKRKWERIVNREPHYPSLPFSNAHTSTPTTSVVDGLKEGVKLLAAGLSDLSDLPSPISSYVHAPTTDETGGVPRRRAQRESDSSTSMSTSSRIGQLSRTSVSSVWDEDLSLLSVKSAEDNEPILTKQTRDNDTARARQEKIFRRRSRDMSHPPPAFTRHATSCNSTSTSVDIGRGSVDLDTTPDVVRETDADGAGTQSKNTLRAKRASLAPPSSMPGVGSLAVVGGAWGNVGRKLGGDVFSKSQKRASTLLSDVSQSIVSALNPSPVATSPAPAPSLFPFPSSLRTTSSSPSTASQSQRSSSPASSSLLTPSSNTSSPFTRSTRLQTRSHTSAPRTGSWLEDDEEENTVHAGRIMMPSVLKPTSTSASMSAGKTSKPRVSAKPGTATATSFDDDDDWNW